MHWAIRARGCSTAGKSRFFAVFGIRRKVLVVRPDLDHANGSSVKDPSDQPSPIGLAFEWVARIFAVVIEMVVPGLLGQYLDGRLGTKFLVLLGFGCGFSLALWHLLVMTRPRPGSGK